MKEHQHAAHIAHIAQNSLIQIILPRVSELEAFNFLIISFYPMLKCILIWNDFQLYIHMHVKRCKTFLKSRARHKKNTTEIVWIVLFTWRCCLFHDKKRRKKKHINNKITNSVDRKMRKRQSYSRKLEINLFEVFFFIYCKQIEVEKKN